MRALTATISSFFLFAMASSAFGADGNSLWNPDGETIAAGRFYATASDEGGGVFVVWDEEPGIRVQLLNNSGVPQWAPAGVQLSSTGSAPAIVAESPWGATIAWEESTGIYTQRVNYSGTALWSSGGVQVATSGEEPLVIHVPGAGMFDAPGAFIAWGEAARLAHIDSSGSVSAPGVNGISLGGNVRLPGHMRMIPDDAGGAIVIWANYAKDIVAQRVNAGLPWGSVPTLVSGNIRDEGFVEAAPDGTGGALISWTATQLVPANAQVWVGRINSSGTALWTSIVVDSAVVGGSTSAWTFYELTSSVASDGAGGAIAAWNDWRNDPTGLGNDDIYAQRLASDGSFVWNPNGILLPPYIVGSTAPGSQRGPRTVSDQKGGAIVTYQDSGGNSWDISATRLDSFGNKLFSTYVFTDFNQEDAVQKWPEIVFDGSGPAPLGAVIAWVDQRNGEDILVQKVEISGPANDDSSSAQAVATGLTSATLLGATQDGLSSCGNGGLVDVWYVFTAPGPGTLEVDTCGTNDMGSTDEGMDSVVSIHSAAPGSPGNELACNDDWTAGGDPPSQCAAVDIGLSRDSATSAVVSSGPVWIRVSHWPATSPGDFSMNVRYVPEPHATLLLASGAIALVALRRVKRRK